MSIEIVLITLEDALMTYAMQSDFAKILNMVQN